MSTVIVLNKEEQELVKFIGKYQYLDMKDVRYFLKSTYYRVRISKLIQNRVLRRYKHYLVLSTNGRAYMKSIGEDIPEKTEYRTRFMERVFFISHLSAIWHNNKKVTFTPSKEIKDKREGEYKKILILINDISRLDLEEFVFGMYSVLICEDSDDEIKKIEKMYEIDWFEIIRRRHNKNAYFSGNELCDFNIDANSYANVFYMLDTENVNRTKLYLMNKSNDSIEVLCNGELFATLKTLLPNANIIPVEMIEYEERKVFYS